MSHSYHLDGRANSGIPPPRVVCSVCTHAEGLVYSILWHAIMLLSFKHPNWNHIKPVTSQLLCVLRESVGYAELRYIRYQHAHIILPLWSFIYSIKHTVLIWANPRVWQPNWSWMAGHCTREKGTNPWNHPQWYVSENDCVRIAAGHRTWEKGTTPALPDGSWRKHCNLL